jgi:hypothetical protein
VGKATGDTMTAEWKAICSVCIHSDGYRCKNEKVAEIGSLITGMQMTGADADTLLMRLSESACGISGKWWEPRS